MKMAARLLGAAILSTCLAGASAWVAPVQLDGLSRWGAAAPGGVACGSRLPFPASRGLRLGRGTALRALQAAEVTATEDYKVLTEAPKCAFLVNTWKTQAEGARATGWTQTSGEMSIENALQEQRKLMMVSNTVDTLAKTMPRMMQKAVAEKALRENPSASFPDDIMKMRTIACVSVTGQGSAAGIYTAEDDFYRIDTLVANTQLDNQDKAQKAVVARIVKEAGEAGIPDVRLAASALDTSYASGEELGFQEVEPGCPWLVYSPSS
eukprot:CAMPEP_0206240116 /NCGR_PEP_ID=MMETSP0047_2-20121206/15764_1 /ASSEMBLY_ACC=CAM_ASM_000192 /TAXON_ID=195065 /ORGANISM="Chroomonas mesostigmatica_cf, Strain CCMP1168" /LENGTH=265 /DNA_ID=CAMNT_0053664871 /DNA_START=1 /DNA_END=798 /DNA_ORIENTATION=+